MALQIACVGLSQISVSAALALSSQSRDLTFKGWDPNLDARIEADRFKVFTPVAKKAQDAVRGANLVLLSLPSDKVLPTLKLLELAMGRDVVLFNLSPINAQTDQFIREVFGKKVSFISLYPVLNPSSLEENTFGARAARSDLFEKSLVFIADAQDAPPAVLDLAVDLAVLMGGQPVFTTPEELDGLIAANLLLPQLNAVALMHAVSSQPSWAEGAQLSGGLLFHSTLPLADPVDDESFGFTARTHGANMVRLVEDLIRELIALREDLKDEDGEKLVVRFNQALNARDQWLTSRKNSNVFARLATSIPGKAEALKRFTKLGV